MIKIHHLFPRLIPSSKQSTSKDFSGYVTIREDDENDTVLDFLKRLKNIENMLQVNDNNCTTAKFEDHIFLSSQLTYLEAIGWENVAGVSPNFSELVLESRDCKNRVHKLKVLMPPASESLIIEADLPTEVDLNLKSTHLLSLYRLWEDALSSFQPFWDVMDEIDGTAFILDPPEPTRKHITRRLIFENRVNIQVTVSPNHPFDRPKYKLLGPSALVSTLDAEVVKNYESWNSENGFIKGLETLFGMKMIKKEFDSANGGCSIAGGPLEIDCAVCYSLHLRELLPDIVCDYCQKKFHLECLYEWLRSLSTSRQIANFMQGDCPFCTKTISCDAPQ